MIIATIVLAVSFLLLYVAAIKLIPFPKEEVFNKAFAAHFLGVHFHYGQLPMIYRLTSEELQYVERKVVRKELIVIFLILLALLFAVKFMTISIVVALITILLCIYAGRIVVTYHMATQWEILRLHMLQFLRERILLTMFSAWILIKYPNTLAALAALHLLWWIILPLITKKWFYKFTIGSAGTLKKIRRGRFLLYAGISTISLVWLLFLGVSPVLLFLYVALFAAANLINNLTTIWQGMWASWIKKIKRDD